MSEKRRDNRNRILRSGESQRKDGRYAYKYTDTFGKVQFVYAWKLVPTDKTPAGKRDNIDFQLNTVIEDDTKPKVPLTAEQEESLLSFMQSDSIYQKYRDEVIILLETELRISELCGLTETDLDF